jgi:glycerol-3-phosphate dehydrogenase
VSRGAEAAYDVVVVGGGVLGTAVAARVAQTTASVCLVEEADDVCEGASKGNAGIATTFYTASGTPDAEYITASWPRFDDLCRRLDVPFSRPGGLTVALDDEEAARLEGILAEARGVGARAELLTGDEARAIEPLLSTECRGAVHLPDEALIDPLRLTCAYAELAVANGAALRLGEAVVGVDVEGERVTGVVTPRGRVRARYVVNAAGVAGGRISALAGGETIEIHPRKGQYWILDRAFGEALQMIVFPVPLPHTHGVQVVPTTNGSVLLGPDARDIEDPRDKSTEADSLQAILRQTERLVPSVTLDAAIKTYAANRPAAAETVRVRPDAQRPNLLHVGNRSTGVSGSPAIAERVLALLRDDGLAADDRDDAVRELEPVRRLLLDDDPESLLAVDERYGQVVCVCEQVTAAEIARALTSRVPARSIEGVRKRTRATAGRCQGSVCMAGVSFLCSLHTGRPPGAIRQGPEPATNGLAGA